MEQHYKGRAIHVEREKRASHGVFAKRTERGDLKREVSAGGDGKTCRITGTRRVCLRGRQQLFGQAGSALRFDFSEDRPGRFALNQA